MMTLLLRFVADLSRQDLRLCRISGPLFHRWLPDGRRHAICLALPDQSAELQLWFERYGYAEDGRIIRFDPTRSEVPAELVARQAILEGGPLHGQIMMPIEDETVAAIRDGTLGDPRYIALGKRIVKRIIEPYVGAFLQILRTNYGQYWIRELEIWDARARSLGHRCARWKFEWSLDGGDTWSPFLPNERKVFHPEPRFAPAPWDQMLTQSDWERIQSLLHSGYIPSFASTVLSRAHELYDQGDVKYALVEGTTALELALDEWLRTKLGGNSDLLATVQGFANLSLKAQLVVASTSISNLQPDHIRDVVRAVDLRNAIVHEGEEIQEEDLPLIEMLLRVVGKLLPDDFKFPPCNNGNEVRQSSAAWDQNPLPVQFQGGPSVPPKVRRK